MVGLYFRFGVSIFALMFAALSIWTAGASSKEATRPQTLRIDSLTFGDKSPMLGETIEFTAVIRNIGVQTVKNATAQFYQGGKRLGAPIDLEPIDSDNVVQITLPIRPNSVGRYSIKVVIVQGAPSIAATEDSQTHLVAPVSRNATLLIYALPQWWTRLDKELDQAENHLQPTNYSRIKSLDGHFLCQNDIRADMGLQRHGQSLMDGIRALPKQPNDARERFGDAVNELSKFVEMLYCIDLTQLEYWDRAIANFWRSMAVKPESDLTFEEAVIATWNPALLVVDSVQITGHSEIVLAFQDLKSRIIKALAMYPTDSYGAAWLDAFGTGQLVRYGGDAVLENLREVLLEPELLGMGMCPLTAHANKGQFDEPCFERLEYVTAGCSATDLANVLAGLYEAGMIKPLLSGNFAAKSSQVGGTPSPSPSTQVVTVKGDELAYFGNRLVDAVTNLCAKLKSAAKPSSMQGMAEAIAGVGPGEIGGCGFALVTANLKDSLRSSGDRALQCLKRFGTHSPRSPLPSATQVRFPSGCSVVAESDADKWHASAGRRIVNLISSGGKITYSKYEGPPNFTATSAVRFPDGSSETTIEMREGDLLGPVIEGNQTRTDRSGAVVFEGSYSFDPLTGHMTRSVETVKNNGTTTQTTKEVDENGNTTITVETRDQNGKTTSTEHKATRPGRPTEPGEGGCPETAAQARAQAIFNCIFAEDMTEANILGTIIPRIRPLEEGGMLPAACNAIDPAALWGSSSGPGVYDPVPWSVTGGPSIFERFIPQIDGVIDPPSEWISIPRMGDVPGAPN